MRAKKLQALRQQGFTLVELMIVIVILGVLAATSIPYYQEYMAKGKREEAKSLLLEGAQALERYYTINGTYLNTAGNGLAAVFPTQSPVAGVANYTIAVQGTATRNAFVLRATRAGSMASDGCGNFEVNQAGARTLNAMDSTHTLAACW